MAYARRLLWPTALISLAGLAVSPLYADDHAESAEAVESAEAEAPKELDPAEQRMKEMKEEISRLKTEYELLAQRQRNAMQKADLELQRMKSAKSHREAELEAELARKQFEIKELGTEQSLRDARRAAELAELRAEIEVLKTESQLSAARRDAARQELEDELAEYRAKNTVMQEKINSYNLQTELVRSEYNAELVALDSKLKTREKRDKIAQHVIEDIKYREKPLKGDTLYISDRRIALNGPIITGTSTYVTDRIHYYNNLDSKAPIFIIIDRSPGGSVMEGYRILEAMKNSDAPVHVVVKQYAASMAALITTLADHSYAYPNAVILHHQMSYGSGGNITMQEEQLESAKEWARRLIDPLADKMGVTSERLIEMMYENASTGDWDEFADVAADLEWVDHVVADIREEGMRTLPTSTPPRPFFFFFGAEEAVDSEGERFIRLPEPEPFDFYFMHNPDRRYRW